LGGCDQLRFSNAVRLGGCDELRFSGAVRLGGCDELNQVCLMLQQVGQPFFAGNIARKLYD
jgi:hypothetical protein